MQTIRGKYNFLGTECFLCLVLGVFPISNDIHRSLRIGGKGDGAVGHTVCGGSTVDTTGNECFTNKMTGTYRPTPEYLWHCTKYLRLFKHTVSRALVTIHVSNDKIYKSEITSVLIRVIYIADFWIGNILPHPWRHTPFNSTISHSSLTWKSYSFEDIFYITHSYNTISLQIKSEKYRCVNWTSEVN